MRLSCMSAEEGTQSKQDSFSFLFSPHWNFSWIWYWIIVTFKTRYYRHIGQSYPKNSRKFWIIGILFIHWHKVLQIQYIDFHSTFARSGTLKIKCTELDIRLLEILCSFKIKMDQYHMKIIHGINVECQECAVYY